MSDHEDDHPLRPTLADTEMQLQSALDEVCEHTVIEAVDTGELIRLEEGLAIASDAAKSAISLRKKIRTDRSDRPEIS